MLYSSILARSVTSFLWIFLKMHFHLQRCIQSMKLMEKEAALRFEGLSISQAMLH